MKPIDWSKPCRTVDGQPLRVLCTDKKDSVWPVLALRTLDTGFETLEFYKSDGSYGLDCISPLDAINAPIKKHGWVNVYPGASAPWATNEVFASEERANEFAYIGRLACVKMEWTES